MVIAFYIDEMNFRGVANSTYQYALKNVEILKNISIIFYNKKNKSNKKEVVTKFKKKFKVYGVNKFSDIDNYQKKLKIKYLYTQKSGNKDEWISKEIKTSENPSENKIVLSKIFFCFSTISPRLSPDI